MTDRADKGYALLAALLVTALAGLFAAAAVAAAAGLHQVGAADRQGGRADAQAWQELDAEAERLRWSPWQAAAAPGLGRWPTARVHTQGTAGASRSELDAVFEVRAPQWLGGLTVNGDVQADAPLAVEGSGAYAGGCVRGRECITFSPVPGPGQPGPPDLAHGDRWPLAAVHAMATIWASGAEIHGGGATYADDTDMHTMGADVAALTQAPDAGVLTALRDGAVPAGAALSPGVLDVSQLPAAPAGAGAADPLVQAAGFVVFVPAAYTPLKLVGTRPTGECPVTLVVDGDGTLGDAASPLSLRGALVVVGHADVAGAAAVQGAVYAGSLRVAAPLTVTTPADWRAHPLAGLATPVIVALAGG